MALKSVTIHQESDKDELDKVLDKSSLDILKAKFPDKIDEVFKITTEQLAKLKEEIKVKNYNKVEEIIREELIEDDIDGKEALEGIENENDSIVVKEEQATLDTITLGSKSEVIDKLKVKLSSDILKALIPFNLKNKQKLNIIVGITGKIINSGILTSFLSGTNDFIENILNGKFNKTLKVGDKAGQFQTIIHDNMLPIIGILEKNKSDLPTLLNNPESKLNILLNNPQAIGNFKNGDNIESIKKISQIELKDYLLGLNKKVLGYDEQIKNISGMKEGFIGALSNTPPLIQNGFKKLLDFLLQIPFIGELLAGLLGYNSSKDAIEGFGEEMKFANATNNLISFGGEFDKFGTKKSDSTNNNKIEVLKDKNLEDLSYKKLIPFYKMCKNEKIDYTNEKLWPNLFNGVKAEKGNEKIVILNEKLNKSPITSDDFDSNKKPNDLFYEKLNNLKIKEKKPQEVKKQKTKEELISERKRVQKDNLLDISKLSEKYGGKLDNDDLEDLKQDISLQELLLDNYSNKIKWQVGIWDYEGIEQKIDSIHNKLLSLKKEKGVDFEKYMLGIIKATKEDGETKPEKFENINFGDLLSEDVLKVLYATENKQIADIDNILNKNKLRKAIKDGLNGFDGEKFNYTIEGQQEQEMKIDLDSQKISLGGKNYTIKLNAGFKLSKIKIVNNIIILTSSLLGVHDEHFSLSKDDFADFLVNLTNKHSIDFKNDQNESVGSIEEDVR